MFVITFDFCENWPYEKLIFEKLSFQKKKN